MTTYELRLGEAFFAVHPDFTGLKPDMVDWAEAHLPREDGTLHLFVPEFDGALVEVVTSRGYERPARRDRPMSEFVISDPFPPIPLAEGFA